MIAIRFWNKSSQSNRVWVNQQGWRFLLFLIAACVGAVSASGDEAIEKRQREIAQKYLSVLLKRPRQGTSLDRVYAYHIQNDSLSLLLDALTESNDSDEDETLPDDLALDDVPVGNRVMVAGLLALHRGDHEAADRYFETAERMLPRDAMCSYYRSKALAGEGRSEEAIEALKRSIARKPSRLESLTVFTDLGNLYSRVGQSDQAIETWKELESHFPGDQRIQVKVAELLAVEGEFREAEDRYRKLSTKATQDNDRIEFLVLAAEMRRKQGDAAQASAELEGLLSRLRPSSWLYREVIDRMEQDFLRADNYSGLADYYARLIEKHPEDLTLRIRQSRYLAIADRGEEAKKSLADAVQRAPSDAALRQSWIELLLTLEEFATASDEFAKLVEQYPQNPDYLIRWGDVQLARTDLSEEERGNRAARIWQRLADANPNDPVTLATVADKLRSIEQVDLAVSYYRRAIDADPESSQYREYLGEYFHELKREYDAIAIWKSIADGNRRNRDSLVRLAEVFETFDLIDLAVDTWEEAAEFDLTFEHLLQHAAVLNHAGKPDRAIERLRYAESIAESNEERERAFRKLVTTLHENDRLVAEIKRQANREPDADNLRRLAVMHQVRKDLPAAAQAIEYARDLDPERQDLMLIAAEVATAQERLSDAEKLYSALSETDLRFRTNHLQQVANLQMRMVRYDAAMETCKLLVQSSPSNAELYRFYARLALDADREQHAIAALRQAVVIAPRENASRRMLASLLAEGFQTEEAIELLWESIDYESEMRDRLAIVQEMTPLYERLGTMDALVRRIDRYGRKVSDHRAVAFMKSMVYESTRQYDRALDSLRPLMLVGANDLDLLTAAVRLNEYRGDHSAALRHQQAVTRIDDTPDNRSRLIRLRFESGQMDSGTLLEDVIQAIHSPDELAELATMSLRKRKYDAVIEIGQELIRRNPRSWEARWVTVFAMLQKAQSVKDLPGAAVEQCMRILSEPGSAVARPKLFAAQTPSQSGQVTFDQYQKWSQDVLRLQQVHTPQIVSGGGVVFYPSQSGRLVRSIPLSATATRQPPIELDSLGHAKTLAHCLVILHKCAEASDKERFLVFQRQWKSAPRYYGTTRGGPPNSLGRGFKQKPIQVESLWHQLVICDLADQLDFEVGQDKTREAARWQLAKLDPQAAIDNLSEIMNLRTGPRQIPGEVGSRYEVPDPLSIDQLETFEIAFQQNHEKLRSPDSVFTDELLLLRHHLVRELRLAGYARKAERYEPIVDDAMSFADLRRAVSFYLLAGRREDAQDAMDLLPASLRSLPESERVDGDLLQHLYFNVHSRAETKRFFQENIKTVVDLVFAATHSAGPVQPTQLTSQAWPQMAIRAVRPGSSSFTVVRPPAPLITNPPRPMPLDSRVFDQQKFDSINLLLTFGGERNVQNGKFPQWLIDHLQAADPSATKKETISKRSFAAFSQWWAGKTDECFRLLKEISIEFPDVEYLKLDLARLANELDRPHEAIAFLEACHPKSRDNLLRQQLALLSLSAQTGDVLRSRDAIQRLSGLGIDTDVRLTLAEQAGRLGLRREAAELVRQIPKNATMSETEQLSLAETLLARGDRKGAGEIAYALYQRLQRQKAANQSHSLQLLNQTIGLLHATSRFKPLIERAQLRVQSAPESVGLRVELARLYEAFGDDVRADKQWDAIAKMGAVSAFRLAQRAESLQSKSRHDEAAGSYLRLVQQSPYELSSRFSEISRAIQRVGREGELYEVLCGIPPNQIPSNLIDDLIRLKSSVPFSEVKRRFIGHAMQSPDAIDYLHDIIASIPKAELATLDAIAEKISQAVADPNTFRVDSPLWRVSSRSVDGSAEGPLADMIRLAVAHPTISQKLETTLGHCLGEEATVATAEFVQALYRIAKGEQLESSSETVRRWAQRQLDARSESKRIPLAGGLLWQAGQFIEKFEGVTDKDGLCVLVYEAAKCDPRVTSGSDPRYGIFHRLVDAYARNGQQDLARAMLLDAVRRSNLRIQSRSESVGGLYSRLRANQWYAEKLLDIGCPIDAAMIYRLGVADPKQFERVKIYGALINFPRSQNRLKVIEASITVDSAIDYLRWVTQEVQDTERDKAVELLDVPVNVLTRVSNRSRLAFAIRSAAGSPAGREAIDGLMKELQRQKTLRPSDWSIPAAQLLVALLLDDEAANDHFEALLERVPDSDFFARAAFDSGIRRELRAMFALYVLMEPMEASTLTEKGRMQQEVVSVLQRISDEAKRPGMDVAIAVLGMDAPEASGSGAAQNATGGILSAIEKESETLRSLSAGRIAECLDITGYAVRQEDWELAGRALAAGLGNGPPLLGMNRKVDPFGNDPLSFFTDVSLRQGADDMSAIATRLYEIVRDAESRLEAKMAGRSSIANDTKPVRSFVNAIQSVVLPPKRKGVVFLYEIGDIDSFCRNPESETRSDSVGRSMVRMVVALGGVEALTEELKTRLEAEIDSDSISELLVQIALLSGDEDLLQEASDLFYRGIQLELPDNASPVVQMPSEEEFSLLKPPPDVAYKTRVVHRVVRTFWPLLGGEADTEPNPVIRSVFSRTASLIGSDPYLRHEYAAIYEKLTTE